MTFGRLTIKLKKSFLVVRNISCIISNCCIIKLENTNSAYQRPIDFHKNIFSRAITMNSYISLIIIAVIGGVTVALQGQFMGLIDKGIGTRESVFITYVSGGILAGVVMLVSRGGNLRSWQEVPWYALSAGVLGLVIVTAIGYTVPRLGLSKAFTIIVASQFLTAALLDHFGLLGAVMRPLDLSRLLGFGVLILGVWLIMK
jgi:transporter family-2 protein